MIRRKQWAYLQKKLKQALFAGLLLAGAGCATGEEQVRQALKKNPKIVFDLIEENPEQFIEVANRAAQSAQQRQYRNRMAALRAEQEKDLREPKKPNLQAERRLEGDSTGDIVIVEYADFQCPACRMAYDSINQFKSKFKGRVQFYYKHMPLDFYPMALPASRYFEALWLQGKDKAVHFFDFVFQNQGQLNEDGFLDRAAMKVGADLKRLKRDIKSERIKAILESDRAEFEKFGFTGTPVILINGVALHGAQSPEELERVANLSRRSP